MPIRELLAYRLHRVANAISRSAALRYRRQFDVSLGEWRAVGLLGEHAPLTLNALARMAGLDKAQMSRVMAGLSERGFVSRAAGPGRRTLLSLTATGQELYEGLITAANERNAALRRCLTEHEQSVLDAALRKLAQAAQELERVEHEAQSDPAGQRRATEHADRLQAGGAP